MNNRGFKLKVYYQLHIQLQTIVCELHGHKTYNLNHRLATQWDRFVYCPVMASSFMVTQFILINEHK